MSKLQTNQLQHTANGAAVYTLPQTDGSAGQVLQTNGSGVLSWVTLPAGSTALNMVDQWRYTTFVALNNTATFFDTTSNWERVDSGGQGVIITSGGMSQTGGIFTFPLTGVYKVEWEGYFEDTDDSGQNAVSIYVSTDGGSNYNRRANQITNVGNHNTYSYGYVGCSTFVDVTNVSDVKVKFRAISDASVSFDGSSTENRNAATFLRLGDT